MKIISAITLFQMILLSPIVNASVEKLNCDNLRSHSSFAVQLELSIKEGSGGDFRLNRWKSEGFYYQKCSGTLSLVDCSPTQCTFELADQRCNTGPLLGGFVIVNVDKTSVILNDEELGCSAI